MYIVQKQDMMGNWVDLLATQRDTDAFSFYECNKKHSVLRIIQR